ncbi:O-antigen ligase family protein [Anaeromyxobacter diazotrophicus]|uniref:O-antigen ligase-related domain-containing protein n=1 Tax=Anaeromyxobacter diazotrophicus TaxID=2590199 RepID=A0A7I9VIX8_9BACT|nr:O-antigen ligase family protein [Anaeromyxobacter diazotrophicus]GEJ56366.1 hypothetical protein AMYX_11070 [Anaeromyxobacter diazotrophicus]
MTSRSADPTVPAPATAREPAGQLGPARLAPARRFLAGAAWAGLAAHAVFLPISVAGMQIGLAVAVGAVVGLALCGRRVWRPGLVAAPVLILCGGAIAAIVVPWLAGFPPLHALDLVFWRAFAAPLAVVLALEAGPDGEDPAAPRRRALTFLALWAAAALLPAAVAWVQVRTGFDPNHALGLRRVARRVPAPDAPGRFAAIGFFMWYTRLSYAMLVVAAFSGAFALLAPVGRRLRLLFAVAALAACSAVVLGGSRAAWGALSVVAVAVALLAGRRVARVAVPLAVVVSLVAGAASPGLRARLVRLATSEDANGDRAMTWRVCRELVREHPWTGTGFNALGVRIDPYFERFAPVGQTRDRCHDVLFSAWAEGGPLFALAVAAWWFLLFRAFLRLRREADPLGRAAAAAVLAGLTGLFVLSLVHDLIWASEAAFAIGGLVGAGYVLARPRAGAATPRSSAAAPP